MTKKDLKLINEAIIKYGDDFWNNDDDCELEEDPNRVWIVPELLCILKEAGLDLKVVKR